MLSWVMAQWVFKDTLYQQAQMMTVAHLQPGALHEQGGCNPSLCLWEKKMELLIYMQETRKVSAEA